MAERKKTKETIDKKLERIFIYLFLYTLFFIAMFLLIKASQIPKISVGLKDFLDGMLVSGPGKKIELMEKRNQLFIEAGFIALISILFNLYFNNQKQFKLDEIIMNIHLPASAILFIIIIICYFK